MTLTPFENMIKSRNFVVLDTETTGLAKPAEIVSIAICDPDGKVLLDSLVKPVLPIPAEATAIHGISDQVVASAPTWPTIQPLVVDLITGKNVVVYNALYDRKMMHLSDEAAGLPRTDYRLLAAGWACAMEWYAEHHGDWNDYHRSYRWQRLTTAMEQQHLLIQDAHHALGDVLMTLALINHIVYHPDNPNNRANSDRA